ncbi:MAG: ArnT family glycosyltransferase [Elusimicrobiales bacterium]
MRKRRFNKTIEYPWSTTILASITIVFISYLVFSNILNKYPPHIAQFIYALNPVYYLKHLNFPTVLSNLKEILFLLIFVYASISTGKILSYLHLLPYQNISVIYLLGIFINSFIVVVTGFLGYISKDLYIFIIFCESAAGIYLILKREFKFDISFKSDFKDNKMLFIASFFVLMMSFVAALSPEIFYDSLNYHLAAPNWWIIEKKIVDMPSHMYYKLPLSHSLIYAFSLSVFGEQNPPLVNFITLFFFALFIAYGFRDFISPKTSLNAGFIFISIFHVFISSQSATGDILPSFAGVVCLRMLIDGVSSGKTKFIFWAGVSCGFAFSSKYNTAFATLPFFLLYLYLRLKQKTNLKMLFREIFVFAAGFLIFSAPWMIKNFIKYSNPLFPFAHPLFSRSTPPDELQRIKGFINEARQFEEINFKDWLTLPFDISCGKIANSELFLPLFIIILPLGFFNRNKNLFIRYLWACFWASYLIWSLSTTYIRHFLPSLFIISVISAYYITQAFEGYLKQIIKMAYIFTMFLNTVYLTNYFTLERRFEPVFGFITKDEFLSKSRIRYPYPSYSIYKYINENLPHDSKILIFGDSRAFYLKLPYQIASVFDKHPLIEITESSKDEDEIYERLKKVGITHIFLNLAEGYRIKTYGNHYFDKKDFEKFDRFFKKHLIVENEIEEKKNNQISQKLILYMIVERNMTSSFNYFNYFVKPDV